MKYYSVDRRGVYSEGSPIALHDNLEPEGNEVVAHINKMYPAGFSRHGMQFFRDPWQNCSPQDMQSGYLELLLEATRKAYYPDKPVRYQSMFACDSPEAAQQFRSQYGQPTDPIYELLPRSAVHRGDMSLLHLNQSFASIDHRMHLYWQGAVPDIPGYVPRWEFVLALPVLVSKKVL